MPSDATTHEQIVKKPYHAPEFEDYGTIQEITLGGGVAPLDVLGTDLGGGGAS
jgi:hypothetical protein